MPQRGCSRPSGATCTLPMCFRWDGVATLKPAQEGHPGNAMGVKKGCGRSCEAERPADEPAGLSSQRRPSQRHASASGTRNSPTRRKLGMRDRPPTIHFDGRTR